MRPTIYGETRKKTEILDSKNVQNFLEKNTLDLQSLLDKPCIYNSGVIVEDPVTNYINIVSNKKVDRVLKSLLVKEYVHLEKVFPKLGETFIKQYFDKNFTKNVKTHLFHKDNLEDFINSIQDEIAEKIIRSIVENFNLEYSVQFIEHDGCDVTIRCNENIFIPLDYDSSYLGSKTKHVMNDFKFVVIDGMIESVGEIHHLMHNAAESKVPHVIFCFDVSPEVKHVIIENNRKGITEVFPVCINYNENTINILSDLSVILASDVVTAQKGQTISQEVRRKLPKCKQITFMKEGIIIKPNASDYDLSMHKKFLSKRLHDAKNKKNHELIMNRMKYLSTKSLKIYIPSIMKKDISFRKELDYGIRMISFANKNFVRLPNNLSNQFYYIPKNCLELITNKIESVNHVYNNIDKIILYK